MKPPGNEATRGKPEERNAFPQQELVNPTATTDRISNELVDSCRKELLRRLYRLLTKVMHVSTLRMKIDNISQQSPSRHTNLNDQLNEIFNDFFIPVKGMRRRVEVKNEMEMPANMTEDDFINRYRNVSDEKINLLIEKIKSCEEEIRGVRSATVGEWRQNHEHLRAACEAIEALLNALEEEMEELARLQSNAIQ